MEDRNIFIDLAIDEQELYLQIKNDLYTKESISIEDIQAKYAIGYAEAHKMYDLLADASILGEIENGRRKVIKRN